MCSLSVGECVVCAFATYVFIIHPIQLPWGRKHRSRVKRRSEVEVEASQTLSSTLSWGWGDPHSHMNDLPVSRVGMIFGTKRERKCCRRTDASTHVWTICYSLVVPASLPAACSLPPSQPNWLDQPAVCLSYSHLVQYLKILTNCQCSKTSSWSTGDGPIARHIPRRRRDPRPRAGLPESRRGGERTGAVSAENVQQFVVRLSTLKEVLETS